MVLKSKIIAGYLLLLVVILIPAKTYCQQSDTAKMKMSFAGYYFPKYYGCVNDLVHLFSETEIDTLTEIIAKNEKLTTNQIAIVTINDSMINRDNLKDYTTTLFNKWRLGTQGKNNGVLILVDPGIRMMEIGNGYGIEKKMSDEETKQIIDNIITPEFKKGDYYTGIKKGLLAVIDKIN